MGDRLLTILQAAEEFNVTTKLLYHAVASGELAAVRFRARGRIRLRPRDVEGWIHVHLLGHVEDVLPANELTSSSAPNTPTLADLLPPPEARRFA